MKTRTIEEMLHHGLGGDGWNPAVVARAILKRYPDATTARYHMISGLWADVSVDGRKPVRFTF